MEVIEKHIYDLENALLKAEIRQSSEKICEILTDDFFEFCSSGDIYYYTKGDVFDLTTNSSNLKWEIKDFDIKVLSEDVILATYKVTKHSELREDKKYSLRSSIWKNFDGKWKMIFHQGTQSSNLA